VEIIDRGRHPRQPIRFWPAYLNPKVRVATFPAGCAVVAPELCDGKGGPKIIWLTLRRREPESPAPALSPSLPSPPKPTKRTQLCCDECDAVHDVVIDEHGVATIEPYFDLDSPFDPEDPGPDESDLDYSPGDEIALVNEDAPTESDLVDPDDLIPF
jgi:hypothetical protein